MSTLPTEMGVLVSLMMIAASLWIPYIVGMNKHRPDGVNSFQRPYDGSGLPDWVVRANRAHLNLLEQALPFAIIILVLHAAEGFTTLTYWTAIVFFWLRVAHAIGMITGFAKMPLRPLIFTAGWVCVMILGVSAFIAG